MVRGFVACAVAVQVGADHDAISGELGRDVSPHQVRLREAVQQHDRIARSADGRVERRDADWSLARSGAPGAATSIALVAPQGDDARVSLATADAEGFHSDPQERGVDAGAAVIRVGNAVPPMFAFRDLDGNGIRVSEQG